MDLFITQICNNRELPLIELQEEWKVFNELYTTLNKMKKPELVSKCKEDGYNSVGAKPDLIKSIIFKSALVAKPAKVAKAKKETVPPLDKNVLSKMTSTLSNVVIRRNQHGNYEHPDTGFVFNSKTREVIGKQVDDEVVDLTKDDINECNRLNFKYVIPFNLGVVETEVTEVDEIDEGALIEDDSSEEEIEYDGA